MEQSHFDSRRAEYIPVVAARSDQLVPQRPAFDGFTESMSPSEFETFCAEQLQKAGWNARVTQTSRDQGVDVVAEKGLMGGLPFWRSLGAVAEILGLGF